MSLISIVISLVVVGVLLWLVNTYIPMDAKIKKVLNIAVMVVVVLWLLNLFGVLDHLRNIRASVQPPALGMSASIMVLQPAVVAGSLVLGRS